MKAKRLYTQHLFVNKFSIFVSVFLFGHIGKVLLAVVHLMNGSIVEFPSALCFLASYFSHCELLVGIQTDVRGLSLCFFQAGKNSTMSVTQAPPPAAESVMVVGRLCKIPSKQSLILRCTIQMYFVVWEDTAFQFSSKE